MRVSVLYFASLKDRAGCSGEEVDLPESADVRALAVALESRHPALAGALGHVRFAVNQRFVAPTDALQDRDEVALIPPVSGGRGGSW